MSVDIALAAVVDDGSALAIVPGIASAAAACQLREPGTLPTRRPRPYVESNRGCTTATSVSRLKVNAGTSKAFADRVSGRRSRRGRPLAMERGPKRVHAL